MCNPAVLNIKKNDLFWATTPAQKVINDGSLAKSYHFSSLSLWAFKT